MSLRKWTSKSIYLDIDTAEIIDKKTALKYYIIIKTIKNVKSITETIGELEYRIECRRKPQLELY